MEFLKLLEGIRNPVLDFIFSTITHLGEETAFLVIAIFIFWCVNKRSGYFIMTTGFIGTLANQIMKISFKVPRPWDIDKSFTIVESARAEATGYSFPSGHTQSAVGTFGGIFLTAKSKLIKGISLAVIILVPLSRMYLGVHTPYDVLAAMACAAVILLVLQPIFENEKRFRKFMPYIILFVTLLAIGFYIYCVYINTDVRDVNIVSARKNARTFMGCTLALIPVYALDSRLIRFKTDGKWYAQILKLAIGLGIVLAIKTFLKAPLTELLGDNERIVRYFLMVLFAGAIWPATFGLFAKMRIGFLDRLSFKKKSKTNTQGVV